MMNTRLKMRIAGPAGLVFVLVLTLAGCSGIRHGLYDVAMGHELKKAGLSEKMIMVGEMPISLLEGGGADKPTIVLIHGFAANKENWVRFARYLTDACHVVAIDLPGHGKSVKDNGLSYRIDAQVQYVHEILLYLGLDQFHLAGNSMGGAIACVYAAAYPDRVQSLLLLAPGGVRQYESQLDRLLAAGKNPMIIEKPDDFYALMDFAMEKKPYIPWPIAGVLAEKAVANKAVNEKIFADLRAGHPFVFTEELEKIRARTLIVWGAQDRLISAENASVFERLIPGSRKIILDDVGHAPMFEEPERTALLYREFMEVF
jgi:pimeloyl-ACP methyl ester carboxylesterase